MTGNKIKSTSNNDNEQKQQQKKAKAKSNGIKCKVEQRVGQKKIKQEQRGKEENEKLKKLKTQ